MTSKFIHAEVSILFHLEKFYGGWHRRLYNWHRRLYNNCNYSVYSGPDLLYLR